MPRYSILTLVDITRSNPNRAETDQLKLGQQSNFNSLVQAIGLRSNVEWDQDPVVTDGRLPDPWQGKAKYWHWEFEVEREQIFEKDGDPVGFLLDDINNVPVIVGLSETVDISPAAFQTKGNSINTLININ